jgi:hypothetical protein
MRSISIPCKRCRSRFSKSHEADSMSALPPLPATTTSVAVIIPTSTKSAASSATPIATVSTCGGSQRPSLDKCLDKFTSGTAPSEHTHFLQLGRNDGLRLSQNRDEFSSRFRVIGGKIGVRSTCHASTLGWKPSGTQHVECHETNPSAPNAMDIVFAVVGEVVILVKMINHKSRRV